jgi:F-type H+-transporting ATPase subunit b
MELFRKLGIDGWLLLAQLVNFSVLLFVLHRFLYRPLLRILDARARQREENDARSRELAERLSESERLYAERVSEAERASAAIIAKTEEEAARLRAQLLEENRVEAARLKSATEAALSREREAALASVAREGEALIRSGVERVLASIADQRTTELYLEKAEKELANI